MMENDEQGELNLGEDIPFNNITSNISTCSQSTTTITQSAAILAAVARYDKFQLYPDYVLMLTHYNPGNRDTERGQAEQRCSPLNAKSRAEPQHTRRKEGDQAGHIPAGGCRAEQQPREGDGQAEQRREQSSSSTITITQSATKQAAVVR